MGGRPGGPGSGSPSALAGFGRVLAGLVIALTVAGCELLNGAAPLPIGGTDTDDGAGSGAVDGATGSPAPPTFRPEEPNGGPAPIASYASGSATLILTDGSRVVLDGINGGPHVYMQFGSTVRWSNGDGWYLTISGAGGEPDMGAPLVTIDRVAGGRHLTSGDPRACSVRTTAASAAGLEGTVTCTNLRWQDAVDIGIDGQYRDVDGLAPFSAEVTFRAAP